MLHGTNGIPQQTSRYPVTVGYVQESNVAHNFFFHEMLAQVARIKFANEILTVPLEAQRSYF